MNTEELYTYILTFFEGKSFENLILNKNNTEYKETFENEYREKIIQAMNTDEYSKVMNKLSQSFLTNLAKGTNSNKFSKEDCNEILSIYHSLIENIGNSEMPYEKIALEHFTKVRNFINKFTSKIDEEKEESTSKYSPEFILEILNVDENELKGKSLDLGCGKKGELVEYLAAKGMDAYGMDMECEDTDRLEQEDWLVKNYPEKEYDLITANLTFTKHFNEANSEEQNDQECFEYAQAYMKILNSLKVGGKWHYVPAVTFIEELLPEDKFEVTNSFVNENIMRTVIKRIK
ncbi:MAG: hypothetical protein J6A15_03410 [Clostridia bacterium]|nr:hypothetical protein [Clostridia bacterium]